MVSDAHRHRDRIRQAELGVGAGGHHRRRSPADPTDRTLRTEPGQGSTPSRRILRIAIAFLAEPSPVIINAPPGRPRPPSTARYRVNPATNGSVRPAPAIDVGVVIRHLGEGHKGGSGLLGARLEVVQHLLSRRACRFAVSVRTPSRSNRHPRVAAGDPTDPARPLPPEPQVTSRRGSCRFRVGRPYRGVAGHPPGGGRRRYSHGARCGSPASRYASRTAIPQPQAHGDDNPREPVPMGYI